MYHIEVHNIINRIVHIYQRLGMWRNEKDSKLFCNIGLKLIYLILNVQLPICLISGGFLSDDKNKFVFSVGLGIINVVLTMRLTYILWRENEIRQFLLEIGFHSVADFEEFSRINEKLKKLIQFSSYFLLTSAVGCVLESILYLPIFSTQKRLPLDMWFPLDWKNSLICYCVVFVSLSIAILIAIVAISLNVIIWYLMMNCAIKYEILGHQFKYLTTKKASTNGCTIADTEKKLTNLQGLIGLIKSHQKLAETVDRFKSCFEMLFFVQIITSGICICASVYMLAFHTNHDDLAQSALNWIALLYNLFDIFMVMLFGYEIKLSSNRLSYEIFESEWMEQSTIYQKYVIIVVEALKKPQDMRIAKLFSLNLETFTSIINFAYSSFNILKNFK